MFTTDQSLDVRDIGQSSLIPVFKSVTPSGARNRLRCSEGNTLWSYPKQVRSRSLTPLCRNSDVNLLESVRLIGRIFIFLGGPKAHGTLRGVRDDTSWRTMPGNQRLGYKARYPLSYAGTKHPAAGFEFDREGLKTRTSPGCFVPVAGFEPATSRVKGEVTQINTTGKSLPRRALPAIFSSQRWTNSNRGTIDQSVKVRRSSS